MSGRALPRASSAPPAGDCNPGMETLEDGWLRGHITRPRDALAEGAQDGHCGGVMSAIGTPEVDVLGVESVEVVA